MLDYAENYPKTIILYHTSNMILYGDMDEAYLVPLEYRSLIAGNFYLNNYPAPTDTPKPKLNSTILTILQTLKNVVASAA